MPPDGKYALGLRGFPTPNYVPTNDGYILFYLPADNEWSGLILGAAQQLAYHWNWYQWGDMLPEEAAEAFREIVNQAPYNLIEGTMPTPFWDEDSDVDDELPDDAQPWYGYVTNPEAPADELDFVTNAAIWTITGFLAVATWEIGAAPAILFNTVAPKFMLAVRRGDIGEIIRLWVDGSQAAEVDTSSYAAGDIIRVPVAGDPALSTHQIIMVQVS